MDGVGGREPLAGGQVRAAVCYGYKPAQFAGEVKEWLGVVAGAEDAEAGTGGAEVGPGTDIGAVRGDDRRYRFVLRTDNDSGTAQYQAPFVASRAWTMLRFVSGDFVARFRGRLVVAPPLRLCTDNAVMVAWAGVERLRLGMVSGLDAACRPRWPL